MIIKIFRKAIQVAKSSSSSTSSLTIMLMPADTAVRETPRLTPKIDV